jgi:hypothetical protein
MPWPRRSEREAAVRAALRQAEESRRAARKAEELASDLRKMAGDDLAQAIAEGLMRGEGKR